MAVYTDVSDEELEAFLLGYDLGSVLSFKGIAEGVENSNFFLRTTTGSFILTLYEKRVNEADLPFFVGLMEHLAGRGLACPRPVRNREGAAIGTLAKRKAAIVTFLDGISHKRPNASHCKAFGKALAKLHEAGRGFERTRANALGPASWPSLAQPVLSRADEVSQGFRTRIETALEEVRHWPQNLPQGLIHADLFPDNVFFIGDDVSGLIDFYFACSDALAYDLAICLNAWCFETDGAFNLTKGQALIEGYHSIRPLTAAEIEALPMLCRGAALRFLLTRLTDWLNVPQGALVRPKDPLEYDRKLSFHRRVQRPSEYGFLA